MRIIRLEGDLYGVYGTRSNGPYGTPLLYKGTLHGCLDYRKHHAKG